MRVEPQEGSTPRLALKQRFVWISHRRKGRWTHSAGLPPARLPSTRASAQQQGQHMKAKQNTRSCCLHGTELEQPAHLDTPRLPRAPLDPTCPPPPRRTSPALGGPLQSGVQPGRAAALALPAPLCSPKLPALRNGSVNPPTIPASTYHSSEINGHQRMASQEEVV